MKANISIELTNAENFPYLYRQVKDLVPEAYIYISIMGIWKDKEGHLVFLNNWKLVHVLKKNEFVIFPDNERIIIPFRYDNLAKDGESKIKIETRYNNFFGENG